MATSNQTVETLNDLVRINNDRIDGYQKAQQNLHIQDVDLKALFGKMAEQSMLYRQQLADAVVRMNGQPEDDTRLDGKLFRLWMDLKAIFNGNSREAALESCERGEDAIQRAYDTALRSDAELPAEIRTIILEQKFGLQESHDVIKTYRDMHRKAEV